MINIIKFWNNISLLNQRIFLFLIGNLIINIFMLKGETALDQTFGFLSRGRSLDSLDPMFAALKFLQGQNEGSVYSHVFFDEGLKFQYPLTSLLPLAWMRTFLSESNTERFLMALSWIAIIATIIICIKVFNLMLGEEESELKVNVGIRNFLLFCLGITFFPLIKAFTLGQVQVFINFFFTLSVWLWLKNRSDILPGFLVGLMLLIKPQYGVICIWGLIRKKWIFSAVAIVTAIAGFLISILVFGLSKNLDYLSFLKFVARYGESFYYNQSLNGLLHRLLFNGDNLMIRTDSFPPFNPIVYFGTTISSFLLILWGFLGFSGKKGTVFDYSHISLVCTVASPIAWNHHYGILLIIYSLLIPLALKQHTARKHVVFYAILLYFLASNSLEFTNSLANIPFLNILQSYLFFAVLGTLFLLNRVTKYMDSKSIVRGD